MITIGVAKTLGDVQRHKRKMVKVFFPEKNARIMRGESVLITVNPSLVVGYN